MVLAIISFSAWSEVHGKKNKMRRKQHLFMALISLAMIVALYLLCTGNSQFEEAALAQSARDESELISAGGGLE